jgi:hypothetical protein
LVSTWGEFFLTKAFLKTKSMPLRDTILITMSGMRGMDSGALNQRPNAVKQVLLAGELGLLQLAQCFLKLGQRQGNCLAYCRPDFRGSLFQGSLKKTLAGVKVVNDNLLDLFPISQT